MSTAMMESIDLTASDAAGQQHVAMKNIPLTARIRDLIPALQSQMRLSSTDSSGRPVNYQAFNKSDGSHLRGDDIVGHVLREGDEVSLLPDIQAGRAG